MILELSIHFDKLAEIARKFVGVNDLQRRAWGQGGIMSSGKDLFIIRHYKEEQGRHLVQGI